MCMLTYYAPDARPDVDALHNGSLCNDDGHGFAIITSKGLLIHHGMVAGHVIDRFDAMRAKYPDMPALFHSRFGTAGRMDRSNCHPFRIRGDRRTVIAHNGVFPSAVRPRGKDFRSDTRILADNATKLFGPLHKPESRTDLTLWMGKYNKVVILTTNPAYDRPAYILNEGAGHWLGDTWYSNYDHEPYYPPTAPLTVDGELDRTCAYCGSEDALSSGDWCLVCRLCQDCGEDALAGCQCYRPRDTMADDEYAGWWSAQLREEMGAK